MKTKAPVLTKQQTITVKDLKTKKNPKGGAINPVPGLDVIVKKNYPHK